MNQHVSSYWHLLMVRYISYIVTLYHPLQIVHDLYDIWWLWGEGMLFVEHTCTIVKWRPRTYFETGHHDSHFETPGSEPFNQSWCHLCKEHAYLVSGSMVQWFFRVIQIDYKIQWTKEPWQTQSSGLKLCVSDTWLPK